MSAFLRWKFHNKIYIIIHRMLMHLIPSKIFFNDIFFSISYSNYVQQHLQKKRGWTPINSNSSTFRVDLYVYKWIFFYITYFPIKNLLFSRNLKKIIIIIFQILSDIENLMRGTNFWSTNWFKLVLLLIFPFYLSSFF